MNQKIIFKKRDSIFIAFYKQLIVSAAMGVKLSRVLRGLVFYELCIYLHSLARAYIIEAVYFYCSQINQIKRTLFIRQKLPILSKNLLLT